MGYRDTLFVAYRRLFRYSNPDSLPSAFADGPPAFAGGLSAFADGPSAFADGPSAFADRGRVQISLCLSAAEMRAPDSS